MAGRFFRLTEEESRLAVCGLRTLHKVVRFSFRLFLVDLFWAIFISFRSRIWMDWGMTIWSSIEPVLACATLCSLP